MYIEINVYRLFTLAGIDTYTKFRGFFSKGGGLFLRGGEMVSHGESTAK